MRILYTSTHLLLIIQFTILVEEVSHRTRRLTDPDVQLSKRIFGPKTRKQFDAPRPLAAAGNGHPGPGRDDVKICEWWGGSENVLV